MERQADGYIALADILNSNEMRELGTSRAEVKRIVQGEGRNHKMRFEIGRMKDGREALRTSQGHSAGSGVTSDYLEKINP